MQMCANFVLFLVFNNFKREISCFFGGEGVDVFALLDFVKIWGLQVRRIGVCVYRYGYG